MPRWRVPLLSIIGNTPMTSIDIPELLTIIYVEVDDWYQAEGQELLRGKPGAKPTFSDSEMMTLMLVQDYIPYPGETQFVAYIRANHLDLFPKLPFTIEEFPNRFEIRKYSLLKMI